MPSDQSSGCESTRGDPQAGQRVPVSNGVRQERQRAGIGSGFAGWVAPSYGQCAGETKLTEFNGAKILLFVGAQIIVLRRDEKPGLPWSGMLDLPGGGREGDESAEQCIRREVQEELGLILAESDLRRIAERVTETGRFLYFAAVLPEGAEAQIVFGDEGQGWMLTPPDRFAASSEAIPHLGRLVGAYILSAGKN